jgi:hypothetical protein
VVGQRLGNGDGVLDRRDRGDRRHGAGRRQEGVGGRSALELLEERYARGEVTRDEFLDRRAVLTDKGTQGQT